MTSRSPFKPLSPRRLSSGTWAVERTPGGRGGGTRQAGSDPRASGPTRRALCAATPHSGVGRLHHSGLRPTGPLPLAVKPASGWRSWQGAAGAVAAGGYGVSRDRALRKVPPVTRLLGCAPWDGVDLATGPRGQHCWGWGEGATGLWGHQGGGETAALGLWGGRRAGAGGLWRERGSVGAIGTAE